MVFAVGGPFPNFVGAAKSLLSICTSWDLAKTSIVVHELPPRNVKALCVSHQNYRFQACLSKLVSIDMA